MNRKRGRNARSTDARISRQIPPKESVLIVCEGEKTEPQYFTLFGEKEGLIGRRSFVEVEVVGKKCGSAPISVVNFALAHREERAKIARTSQIICEYDRIYDTVATLQGTCYPALA
ncbi:MAG: RloB domain-containing protein [Phycisphaerae bacterium]|nr:RloB domain-containing protein [Phycisphaerae bacterium]